MQKPEAIVQGIIFGWVAFFLVVTLTILAGIWSQITGFNVVLRLRIGLFLTAVTVITRFISTATAFMVPAILAGILAFDQTPTLNGSAKKVCQLMEASMTRGLLSTGKACFYSGETRKLSIAVASVLMLQYVLSATDLYLHVAATGRSQRLPGERIPSTRALQIATNCSERSYGDTCGQWTGLASSSAGVSDPIRTLEVYRNVSKTLQVWRADGGLYLLQSPPLEKAYSYSGNGIYLKPFCESISNICNLRSAHVHILQYNCPESFWSVSGTVGSTPNDLYNVILTSLTDDNVTSKTTTKNPIDLIVSAKYSLGDVDHDSEFAITDGGDLGILMHCQIFASTIEYVVTLGSLKANPLGNLTNAQLLAIASATGLMAQRAISDVMDIAFKGNSTLYVSEFAQQFAQVTIASFVGAVQENGDGYDYVLEVTRDETIVPLSAVLLYIVVITLPLLVFSSVGLCSLRNRSADVRINWILSEFLCAPQRLFYQAFIEKHNVGDGCLESLAVQEKMMANYVCRIGEKEHFQILENHHRNLTHKEETL